VHGRVHQDFWPRLRFRKECTKCLILLVGAQGLEPWTR
jgi:hypothetical protein